MKNILSLLIFSILYTASYAQIAPTPNPPKNKPSTPNSSGEFKIADNLFTGGSFNLAIGNTTFIELSPNLGVKLNDKFRTGIGASYKYYRIKTAGIAESYQIYGLRLFTMYEVFEKLVLFTEYEQFNRPFYSSLNGTNRSWINNTWVGIGYRSWMSEKTAVDLLVIYDLNYNASVDLYASPLTIRMNFIFDL